MRRRGKGEESAGGGEDRPADTRTQAEVVQCAGEADAQTMQRSNYSSAASHSIEYRHTHRDRRLTGDGHGGCAASFRLMPKIRH